MNYSLKMVIKSIYCWIKMGIIETSIDVVTNNQISYKCPTCQKYVWAYGSFAGNICWKCPGTLFNATVGTIYMFAPIGLIMTPLIKHQVGVRAKYPKRQVAFTKYKTEYDGQNQIFSNLSEQERADKIISCQVFSCRISHGLYFWAVGLVKKMGLCEDEIEHWWVIVKTQSGKYYTLQQDNGTILLHCNSSLQLSHQCGLASANKCYNSSIWKQPRFSKQIPLTSNRTINDVLSWLQSSDSTGGFDSKLKNSQTLCQRFHRVFI